MMATRKYSMKNKVLQIIRQPLGILSYRLTPRDVVLYKNITARDCGSQASFRCLPPLATITNFSFDSKSSAKAQNKTLFKEYTSCLT